MTRPKRERWRITEVEDGALQGLSVDAQVIYLRAIRRHMDYGTGISTVTYGQMKCVLEYIPDAGSQLPARRVADISNDHIRARLAELERAGLIVAQPKRSRFEAPSFSCLRVNPAELRPKKEPQGNPKGGAPSSAPSETLAAARVSGEATPIGTPREPQGGNPKISGNPVGSTKNLLPNITSGTSYQHTREGGDGPTPAGAMAVALRSAGIDVTSMHPTLLAWVSDGFTPAQLLEAVELARVHKPAPQRIPANYLDRVLRNQAQAQPVSGGTPHEARHPIDNSAVARVRRANNLPEPCQPGERIIEGQCRRT